MAHQTHSGRCSHCNQQVMVRRHQYANGWGLWLCTRCGSPAHPDARSSSYLYLVIWALAVLDVLLCVALTHPALIRAMPF